MPPQKRPPCQICNATVSKYTCATCKVVYCSVPCYKQHKAQSCSSTTAADSTGTVAALPESLVQPSPNTEELLNYDSVLSTATEPTPTTINSAQPDANEPDSQAELDTPKPPLRTLTSLNWPYVPEESAYPDPLKRDDPKSLQLRHYEAIATAPAVRTILSAHPQLPALLRSLDALRGPEREDALQRALGVSTADLDPNAHVHTAAGRPAEEDVKALRALAEAIEAAVRGGKEDALGLDWEG